MIELVFSVQDVARTRFSSSPMDHLLLGAVGAARGHYVGGSSTRERWWRRVRAQAPAKAAPFIWPDMERVLQADIQRRARTTAEHGPGAMLGTLHPQLAWHDRGVLEYTEPPGFDGGCDWTTCCPRQRVECAGPPAAWPPGTVDTAYFRFALAGCVAERFDVRRNGPARYHLAATAVGAMADVLPEPMLGSYARAVLDGLAREEEYPGPGFVRWFDSALNRAIGELDDHGDGFHEAWHIVMMLRGILPGGEPAVFIECGQEALDRGGPDPDAATDRQRRTEGHPVAWRPRGGGPPPRGGFNGSFALAGGGGAQLPPPPPPPPPPATSRAALARASSSCFWYAASWVTWVSMYRFA